MSVRAALAVLASAFSSARAQEALSTPAATMPGPGSAMVRLQFMAMDFDEGPSGAPRDGRELLVQSMASYGVAPGMAIDLRVPFVARSLDFAGAPDGDDEGVGDPAVAWRWRVWKRDTSPIDTSRVVVSLGTELPVGDRDVSSHSFDPFAGVAYTQIRGHHGFSAGLGLKWNTGDDDFALVGGDGPSDAVRVDAAYVYRLWPERFSQSPDAAGYAVLEANVLYETNGDQETYVAPGYLYEGSTWAWEIGVQIPAWIDVDHRAEPRGMFVVGVRYLF